MAFLYNVAVSRELQEGDQVRILSGPRRGRAGTVVGFDLLSERPILVQYQVSSGLLRESFTANAVEVTTCGAPDCLEPLPEIRRILRDSTEFVPCGKALLVRQKDGRSISLIPKRNTDLRAIYESGEHQSIEDRVLGLLRNSYVTRRPHLVRL